MYHPELYPQLAKNNKTHEAIPIKKKQTPNLQSNRLEGISVLNNVKFSLEKLYYKSTRVRKQIDQYEFTNKHEILPFLDEVSHMSVNRFIPNTNLADLKIAEVKYNKQKNIDNIHDPELKEKATNYLLGYSSNAEKERELYRDKTPSEIFEYMKNMQAENLTEKQLHLQAVRDGVVKGDLVKIKRSIEKERKHRQEFLEEHLNTNKAINTNAIETEKGQENIEKRI